jgi:ABC-type amino acid transport substrate-binding protein
VRSTIRVARIIIACYVVAVISSECTATGVTVDPVLTRIQARGLLKVGYDPGILPFTTIIANQAAGFDIDVASAVAQRLGVAVEYVPTGLDAAYDELQQGHFDIIVSAMPYAPEQGWRARFSEFYFDDGLVVVTLGADGMRWQTSTLGVVFGSDADTYTRRLRYAGTIATPAYFDTPVELWHGLVCGQVSHVVVSRSTALRMQHTLESVVLAPALTFAPLVIVMPQDAVALSDVVNTTLATARRDGVYADWVRHWFTPLPTARCPQ